MFQAPTFAVYSNQIDMSNTQKAKAARMRKIVARFYETGQSVSDFCESSNINEGVLRYWQHKFKDTLSEPTPAIGQPFSGFREISVVPPPPPSAVTSGSIVLETPSGITLRFPLDYSSEALANLINGLSC